MGPLRWRQGPAERRKSEHSQQRGAQPSGAWVHSPEGSPARKARPWRAVHSLCAESLTLLTRSLRRYPLCRTHTHSLRLLVQPVLLLTADFCFLCQAKKGTKLSKTLFQHLG